MKSTVVLSALAASASAAVINSSTWTTLTPSATAPEGATTEYTSTFGIAVIPLTTSSSSAANAKRDVISQISDGQIQATTSTKAAVSTKTSSSSAKSTAQAVSQIGDGQIQASTSTSTSTKASKSTAQAVSQIGDGQIQASTSTSTKSTKTTSAVSQISDGQVQATSSGDDSSSTTTKKSSSTTKASSSSEESSSSTASSTSSSASSSSSSESELDVVSCKTSGSLALTLEDGILTDSEGRIGSIVSNRQFQFDGPPPQAGAIYAAGWSIYEGYLTIGNNSEFYQCLSGTFYNLYDESIGDQCTPIKLEVVGLVDC